MSIYKHITVLLFLSLQHICGAYWEWEYQSELSGHMIKVTMTINHSVRLIHYLLLFVCFYFFKMTSWKQATLNQINPKRSVYRPANWSWTHRSDLLLPQALRHRLTLVTVSVSRSSICIPSLSKFQAHDIGMALWQRPGCCQRVVYARIQRLGFSSSLPRLSRLMNFRVLCLLLRIVQPQWERFSLCKRRLNITKPNKQKCQKISTLTRPLRHILHCLFRPAPWL